MERLNSGQASPSTKKLYVDAAKAMDNINLTLLFNKNYSVFQKDKNLAVDGSEMASKMAEILTNKGTFYTNLAGKEQLLKKEFQGEIYNVRLPFKNREWDLTQEIKKIGDFKCYKAIMTVETPGGNFPVIAWYTPEIPISYGPADFVGGLPGLILELHDTAMSYSCSSILLNPKEDIDIEWPKDKEIISEEDYKKAGEELKKKLKPNGN